MAKIEEIVNKQVRTWSKSIRDATREGRASAYWPIVTISREFGALGAALANRIGKKAGFSVWNRELVQAIAEDAAANEELVGSLDEHRRKSVEDAVLGALMGSKVTNVQYLRSLMRLVHTISTHGRAIIVGRGANYICRADQALKVRLVCPLADRVRGYSERQGISEREAKQIIQRMDNDRADFVRRQFRRDVTSPADYDLVLNSSTFNLDQLVDLVLEAYEARFGRKPG